MAIADAIVLAAAFAASRATCREALAIAFPCSTRAKNSCLDSWGSKSLNFYMGVPDVEILPSEQCLLVGDVEL